VFIKIKSEVLHYSRSIKLRLAETNLRRKLNNYDLIAREYFSNNFSKFFTKQGVIHEKTPPPQYDGIIERIILHSK
jgi:hypothetical protein